MAELGVDALLLSHGADLPWLTGYRAMPLERLTMLVLPETGDAVLVVPVLEAPRVAAADTLFTVAAWSDAEDPSTWSSRSFPGRRRRGTPSGHLRSRLDHHRAGAAAPVAGGGVDRGLHRHRSPPGGQGRLRAGRLRLAGAAADRVAAMLQAGKIGLVGRTESEVSAQLATLLIAEGHHQVNFAIVGSGPNAASPHHEAGDRVIGPGETVVCDFGGRTRSTVTSATARTSPVRW